MLFHFLNLFVIFLQISLTSSTTACLGADSPCYVGDCCADFKCFYALPSIQLKGFCEKPAKMLSEKYMTTAQLQIKAKYDAAMSSANLRKESR